jgi:hypothetical protein
MMMRETTQTNAQLKTRWSARMVPKNRNKKKRRTKTKEWSLRSMGRRELERKSKRKEKKWLMGNYPANRKYS